ncbi:RbsD/FucU family protein [Acuticoccus kandeliae]|uniref:RbsD/FucU family protein n=1 Tax=Acuticoccus kandeliae TaxID=2073160 RepID=UPI000D3E3644|nr:RbsD/FucU domain-containing protein [Acuticoccus kandeliae]
MLKGISPLLNADVLYALRAMGHGDTLVVTDTNFPSDSIARVTPFGHLLRIDNVDAAAAVDAILSVLPVEAVARMEVIGAPDEIPPVQEEVAAVIARHEPTAEAMAGIERFAFYDAAKEAYAVLTTGERRFYGCFILRKGVVPPDA